MHRVIYSYVGLGTIFLFYLDPSHPTRGWIKAVTISITAKMVIFKFHFETNTSCALDRVHMCNVGLRFH